MTLQRLRQIGWISLLLACTALFVALTLGVNATKSEVRLAEKRIVQLREANLVLETEFETRANQAQLAAWNAVDFGYEPPAAGQFLSQSTELAHFGTPRAPGAPDPIRVAQAGDPDNVPEFPLLVSPLTGKPVEPERVEQHATQARFLLGRGGRQTGAVPLAAETLP